MAYRVGDIVEVVREGDPGAHGFKAGDKVRVVAVFSAGTIFEHYKCDGEVNGRKRSWYVNKKDLVKRRKK